MNSWIYKEQIIIVADYIISDYKTLMNKFPRINKRIILANKATDHLRLVSDWVTHPIIFFIVYRWEN